jgi:hypothetical protein
LEIEASEIEEKWPEIQKGRVYWLGVLDDWDSEGSLEAWNTKKKECGELREWGGWAYEGNWKLEGKRVKKKSSG